MIEEHKNFDDGLVEVEIAVSYGDSTRRVVIEELKNKGIMITQGEDQLMFQSMDHLEKFFAGIRIVQDSILKKIYKERETSDQDTVAIGTNGG